MSIEFALPELGENVEKGDVTRVLVKVGDMVKKDQPVVELETDKATIEVPSSVQGKVSAVRVKTGDKVKVGQTVLVLEEVAAEAPAKLAAAPSPATATAPKAVDSSKPAAAPDPEPAKSESVRAAEPEKPAGKPAPVVDITTGRQASAAAAATPAPASDAAGAVPAAPSVRRDARELGVEIAQVEGSGPGGRIGQEDVKEHVKVLLSGSAGPVGRSAPLPDFTKWGAVDVTPMSNIRRKTAEHLSWAWQAPHVTQHDKADMTALEQFRKTYGARVEKAGAKLTVTVVLLKIITAALDRFPQFASSLDMGNNAIVVKRYRHIGVAVDTPNGLLVPVLRDVDRRTMTELAVELAAASQKAQQKKLSLDDMAGGVFTISNLGGIGGTAFTPLINPPEVAILGVSRGAFEPVWRDGEFEPRQMLPLSLSYDHRVIDGADAARFLRYVAEAIEQPLSINL